MLLLFDIKLAKGLYLGKKLLLLRRHYLVELADGGQLRRHRLFEGDVGCCWWLLFLTLFIAVRWRVLLMMVFIGKVMMMMIIIIDDDDILMMMITVLLFGIIVDGITVHWLMMTMTVEGRYFLCTGFWLILQKAVCGHWWLQWKLWLWLYSDQFLCDMSVHYSLLRRFYDWEDPFSIPVTAWLRRVSGQYGMKADYCCWWRTGDESKAAKYVDTVILILMTSISVEWPIFWRITCSIPICCWPHWWPITILTLMFIVVLGERWIC